MEKKNGGLIAIIIILIITLFGVCSYIAYDKGLIFNNNIENEKEENNNEKNEELSEEKELDINSRLVQSLYNKVTTSDNNTCMAFWEYGDLKNNFYIDKADEKNKMHILGNNLNENKREFINCNTTNIPDTITHGVNSVCYYQKTGNTAGMYYNLQYAYSKEYIETLYKELYGNDAILDTSVPITDRFGGENYYYNESLNKYVLYVMATGGTCSPEKDNAQLIKAVKSNNELKIYEKFIDQTIQNDGTITSEEYTVAYTFKLEEDGMYSFYSRVKE